MLQKLKLLLGADSGPSETHGADDLQLAAAVLLIEAASLDGDFSAEEHSTIDRILQRHFGLNKAASAELMRLAENAQKEASHLQRYTLTVKDELSESQRLEVIELLWEVVYADGELHAYEANLLRRIGGLLYVPDRDTGEARKRVLERLGVTQ